MADNGRFQINDILLNIPPEQISVNRQSVNHQWQTLRTRSSIKAKSGFSMLQITCNVKFTDTPVVQENGHVMNGLDQLRDLVSQLRVTPFCYVENQFIRNAVLGGAVTNNMALALRQMEIRKSADDTNVVDVYLHFSWFNYLPFTRDFSFKSDIFTSEEVKDPRDSRAFQLLYRAEQARNVYTPIKSLDGKCSLHFTQFAMLQLKKYENIKKEINALKELRSALQARIEGNSEFSDSLGRGIERSLKRSLNSDEHAKSLSRNMFGDYTSMFHQPSKKGQIAAMQEVISIISRELNPGTNEDYTMVLQFEDSWAPVITNVGNTIRFKNEPTATKKESVPTPEETVLLERKRKLVFEDSGLILTGVSISFENILATMPLIGHPYPSYQHIGSIDGVVNLSIMTTSEESIRELSAFYSVIEDQAFKFRQVPQGQRNVHIVNDLINMCGLHEFVLNSIVIDTVPGQPGTYSARLEMVDNPLLASTREKILPGQSFTSSHELRVSISKILTDNIKLISGVLTRNDAWFDTTPVKIRDLYTGTGQGRKLNEMFGLVEKGYYKYPGPDATRNPRFAALCQEYGQYLGDVFVTLVPLLQKTGAYNESSGPIAEFFALEDTDVFSIERLQEDLQILLKSGQILPGEIARKASDLTNLRTVSQKIMADRSKFAFERFQTFRKNRLSNPNADEFLHRIQEESFFEQLDFFAKFIQDRFEEWQRFSVQFIDKILLTDVLELPQFDEIRKKVNTLPQQSSGDSYPDFPLSQIIEILKQDDDYAIQQGLQQLNKLASQNKFGTKNIGLSALIGPDFYFYNMQNDTLETLFDNAIIKQAIDAIKTSQGDPRIDAEEDWFTNIYDRKILGKDKLDAIVKDREREDRDEDFWQQGDDDARIAVQDAIRAQMRSQRTFHSDDLVNIDGEGLACSIAETARHHENISLKAIDGKLDEQNYISQRRPGTKLEPTDYHAQARHRFGSDAIDFLSEQEYISTDQPPDPSKIPRFVHPVEGGKTKPTSSWGPRKLGGPSQKRSKHHNGVDFGRGRGLTSLGSKILAAADGTIDGITAEDKWLGKVGETWGEHKAREWNLSFAEFSRRVTLPDFLENGEVNKDKIAFNKGLLDQPRKTTIEVLIKHDGGVWTKYKHLQWDEKLREMSRAFHNREIKKVSAGEEIGRMGDTGYSTGVHLHFEVLTGKKKYSQVDPMPYLSNRKQKSQGPLAAIDPQNESLFVKSIQQLEKDLSNGQGYSMARAYPTFRLYFIESDLGERKRFGFDDFFSYSAVKEIQVIRSRKIAADLCIIDLTNISGVLSNRKFRNAIDPTKARDNQGNVSEEKKRNPLRTNTALENPIASLMLQPGQQIQLRLGYNSNPDELETVFNGVITDVQFTETDDLVRLTCQSFAVELVQNMHGDIKDFGGFLSNTGRTGNLLEEMMAFPEVVHFGRWEGGSATQSFRGLLTTRWKVVPSPRDDNIFAPTGRGIFGIFDSTPQYLLYQSTIWDTFQEMTLRHPGYCAYPVPYEDRYGPRMTMFFGLPDQMYFARDPSIQEVSTQSMLKKIVAEATEAVGKRNTRTIVDKMKEPDLSHQDLVTNANNIVRAIDKDQSQLLAARDLWLSKTIKNYALDAGIIRPFRNYHILNSTQHILQNSIQNSISNTFNTVTLQYGDKGAKDPVKDSGGPLVFGDLNTFTLKCDAALPDEDVREMFAQYPNCVGYEQAVRYCLGLLFYSLKEGYKGTIVSIGNPKIKPYDICYIFDEYTDMFGPIEVEQVVHKFSQANGFITEVTPDMVIHVNQASTLSTSDAMGLIAEHALKKIGLQSLPSIITAGGAAAITGSAIAAAAGAPAIAAGLGAAAATLLSNYAFAPIASMLFNSSSNAFGGGGATSPFGLIGAFIFRKLITRTQLAQPFRFSPLVKSGTAMIGGLPNKKTDGSFIQGIKTWAKEADDGIPLMLSDLSDKMTLNHWIGHSQGSFADTFWGNTK